MDTRENVGATDNGDGTPFADDIVAVMNDVTDTNTREQMVVQRMMGRMPQHNNCVDVDASSNRNNGCDRLYGYCCRTVFLQS
jgi:hypothetical protein